MSQSGEQFCPAALQPLTETAKDSDGQASAYFNLMCTCEAGLQRMQLEVSGIKLPVKDPRAGKFLCGKTLVELNDSDC